ncbi:MULTISPECIES: LysR family transcriptional regulator [unclassified Vibrio]|uniref:LysR family transcriptional regulator n=1 Tax=unclassified Vibrio TaxID=2614977 RepID=UPI00159E73D4|nr:MULTISPECIES: LysR family transcriptional regulator [unclassified Vibrio]NVN79950.1 LysR family transcriptional regulator [Vibrio sp. Scap16]QLE94657.1 LysR family transcriptional regulator [Vibrio sp. Scap24]
MKAKDISNLYLFCQSVECGGFAAASLQTHVSAPTLSRAVAHLEDKLGEKLVHRNAKQFQLTTAGDEYYQRFASLFSQLDHEWTQLSNSQPVLTGEIRVSCPEPFADYFLQKLAIEFMEMHPEVNISIHFSAGTERFFDEQIDLALVTSPPHATHLIQRQLFESPLVLAASPSYIEKNGTPNSAEELVSHRLLSGNNMPYWDLKQRGKTIRVPYQPKYSVSSLRLNIEATVLGAGICLMPKSSFERFASQDKLVEVLPDVECPTGKAFMLWADRKLIASRVVAFRDMIFERFENSAEFLASINEDRNE